MAPLLQSILLPPGRGVRTCRPHRGHTLPGGSQQPDSPTLTSQKPFIRLQQLAPPRADRVLGGDGPLPPRPLQSTPQVPRGPSQVPSAPLRDPLRPGSPIPPVVLFPQGLYTRFLPQDSLPLPSPPPFLFSLSLGLSEDGTPLENTPPFSDRTHQQRSNKKYKCTRAQLPAESPGPLPDWRRDKASPTWTPPGSGLGSLAAASAVTAQRDARAGFQTDPTWRGLAVRVRDARARRGEPGEGRGARGGGRRGEGTSRGVRSHCLLGSVVSPSPSFGGGDSGQYPRRCRARPPHLRHRCLPPVCSDDTRSLRRAPGTVRGDRVGKETLGPCG